ncbi:hypothetical protein [Microlunatus aurantiacus]
MITRPGSGRADLRVLSEHGVTIAPSDYYAARSRPAVSAIGA